MTSSTNYTIQSRLLQDGRWQPAYLEQRSPGTFAEPTEINRYFETQEEADNFAYTYLIREKGIGKKSIR
jgi:hypothetical protein